LGLTALANNLVVFDKLSVNIRLSLYASFAALVGAVIVGVRPCLPPLFRYRPAL
jgi:hypothetical protein